MRSEEKRFDERQLKERGRAYKFGWASAILTAFTIFFMIDILGVELPTRLAFNMSLWIPLTVTSMIMIVKRAYDGITDYRGMALFTFLGIMSVVLIVITLITGDSVFENGALTDTAGTYLMCLCLISLAVVYWIYHIKDVREYNAEIAEEKARAKKD